MLNLQVTVDSGSGFCFGVQYAVEMAESYLEAYGELYCLGDIVHNDEEVERLKAKGLQSITHEKLKELRNARVLIRAHGEAPSTYEIALANNIELIDASCPVVLKLQNRVKEAHDADQAPIYIYGKHGHAETIGLQGQTNNEAVVFMDPEELEGKELPAKINLFSQTTKDTKKLYAIRDELQSKGVEVKFNDTICRQVSNRDPELQKFAARYDHVVFVSGTKSSNGKVLAEVCRRINPNTHVVSSANELKAEWFTENQTVGIAGATSTPQWQMHEIKEKLETF